MKWNRGKKADEKDVLIEFEIGKYYRQFALSEAIDQGKIDAQLNNGVLKVVLPKSAKAPAPKNRCVCRMRRGAGDPLQIRRSPGISHETNLNINFRHQEVAWPKAILQILGVTSAATPDEVRSAYRRLAKEYHPDHFEGDSGVFRQIQEAYATLGNSQRRAEYEQSLRRSSVKLRRMEFSGTYPKPEPLVLSNDIPI